MSFLRRVFEAKHAKSRRFSIISFHIMPTIFSFELPMPGTRRGTSTVEYFNIRIIIIYVYTLKSVDHGQIDKTLSAKGNV